MITIKNANKQFETADGNIVAVDNVNLKISVGEIFGVIGYSGAGKSTLIRLLNGLEKPTSGTITVANNNISEIKGEQLRQARGQIGMIFQHFNLLWSRTVAENIAFPLEIAKVKQREIKKRVAELVKLVGLEGRENAYPSQLSGGQKQRVGIARALANNPKVLLCDEATSALDPETTDSILDLLVDINKKLNLTIVLITHEMHVIRKICHRVAVMEAGAIVEIGKVLDIFKRPQQQVTKRFVNQVVEEEDTQATFEQLATQYSDGQIVRLTFIGTSAEQPVISKLIRNYPVKVNILQGKISQTQGGSYGTLTIHLDGIKDAVDDAVEFLLSEKVGVEVISHD